MYSHQTNPPKESDDFEKLLYIYQHFQDSEKIHQTEPESKQIASDDDSLYLHVNNDIEYRLFEDIVDSYYLDSQITVKSQMISNATTTVIHNIRTQRVTTILMHAHMTIIT